MRNEEDREEIRTVFCGNLSEDVTDSILYELFNQAGPVESVRRPKDPSGRPKSFGFIVFKHECSVPYAIDLFRGTKLFNRNLNINTRNTQLYHIPVLDTHLTEFSGPQENRSEARRSQSSREDHRNERSRKSEGRNKQRHSKNKQDQNQASSWAELKNDSLGSNGFLSNNLERDDLQNSSDYRGHSREYVPNQVMPDFNALLQLGNQLMGFPGMTGMPNMMPILGLGPSVGSSMFPSMQGRMSGGDRHSPPRERDRRDYKSRETRDNESRETRDYNKERESRREYHERRNSRSEHYGRRESRRDHPYDERDHNRWEDHKRHDRGYSSSRSSHERERRDRRSR